MTAGVLMEPPRSCDTTTGLWVWNLVLNCGSLKVLGHILVEAFL